ATLGADLVARDELQLRPGETRTLQRTLQPDTREIGVVAAFRDLERAQWRATHVVVPNQTQAVTIQLEARAVRILPAATR
ncbi:MAG: type VI secretion system lipoprotein TssJ, partial [Thauera sp.]|nr:type VI secretion system lipoprotein TssJ [Thauera sp.]